MGALRKLAAVAALFVCLAACSESTQIGPLRIVVPDGWHSNRTGDDGLQVANGSVASDQSTVPGSATAVFDLYVDSSRTSTGYRKLLESESTKFTHRTITIDGREADVFTYSGDTWGGSQEAVVVDDYRLLIVYRAAFPNDDNAYKASIGQFRRAVRSISFVAPPPRPSPA